MSHYHTNPCTGIETCDWAHSHQGSLEVTTTLIPAQGLKQATTQVSCGVGNRHYHTNPCTGIETWRGRSRGRRGGRSHYHTNPCTGIETLKPLDEPGDAAHVTTTLIPAQGLKRIGWVRRRCWLIRHYHTNPCTGIETGRSRRCTSTRRWVTTTLIPAQGLKPSSATSWGSTKRVTTTLIPAQGLKLVCVTLAL